MAHLEFFCVQNNSVPSTTSLKSISASTSNTTMEESEDESCQGATALLFSSNSKRKHTKKPHNTYTSSSDNKESATSENKGCAAGTKCNLNANAPEFVPRTSYNTNIINMSNRRLCPYAERNGICRYPVGECTYLHGDVCDLCTRPALHPYNEDLRKKHTQDCIKRHERDMEIAFAVARSKEKVCGICFEVVMQKWPDEQRFGILSSCNHCFCLTCIRKWRQSKQFDNKIIRSCPECRVSSDFVCPSPYWVDTKEEKEKVINKYKSALAKKDCKYFKHGRGNCPFGNKCFYRHCLENGKQVDVGPPPSSNNTNNLDFIGPPLLPQPIDFEIIQRLLLLERMRQFLPIDEIPDDMDINGLLVMLNSNEEDLSTESDDDDDVDFEYSDTE